MSNLTPGRQSPFRRQPSTNSPAPLRQTTPSSSPTKPSLLSPARGGSLPPERSTSFGRRSSQADLSSTRPTSPVARRDGPGLPTRDDSAMRTLPQSPLKSQLDTSLKRAQHQAVASPSLSIASSVDDRNTFDSPSRQVLHSHDGASPAIPEVDIEKIRQPVFGSASVPDATPVKAPYLAKSSNAYGSIPAPLLRSFRESFEVLDPNATGILNASSLPPVLEQLGLTKDSSLGSFFPHDKAQNMNLATYLDSLSAPFAHLSPPEELAAAFGAFDIDDSGQIDVFDLKQALLRTMPEPGEIHEGARLSESEIDGILHNFSGRRAFGAKGLGAQKNIKGDVFRWREFVGNLNGGVNDHAEPVAV